MSTFFERFKQRGLRKIIKKGVSRIVTCGKKVKERICSDKGKGIVRSQGVLCEKYNGSFGYLNAQETILAAEKNNLSVGAYVEKIWNQEGGAQRVVNISLSMFPDPRNISNILEIGPGTGRYLEQYIQRLSPQRYEIYEIAEDWRAWLEKKYHVIAHVADGESLSQTPSNSIDFLHAHGVFVYLPFLLFYRYFLEICRVVRKNGVVLFDIYSEECMPDEIIRKWLSAGVNYPVLLPKKYILDIFEKQGFVCTKSFDNKYGEGFSEYLLFVRERN